LNEFHGRQSGRSILEELEQNGRLHIRIEETPRSEVELRVRVLRALDLVPDLS
jgi:hypothetical protein